MFTTREIQDEILRLKKEQNVCILVHAYQSHDIWEVGDYVGDSYGLSVQAAESDADTVIMCGVRFMAETVKILSPEKRVILANPGADCPMAQQMDGTMVRQMKERNPGYAAVCYVNTTSELKTACDACVTSSSALKIVRAMPQKDILFIPDCNLGSWIAKQLPEKNFKFFRGGCPTHMRVNGKKAKAVKAQYPNALLLVHPECLADVTEQADYVGSTTGIMNYAKKSDAKEFIIGTENSIVQHLQFECPDKIFHPLSTEFVCHNMKLTTIMDVYGCLAGTAGEEITLPEDVMAGARRCLDTMVELGG